MNIYIHLQEFSSKLVNGPKIYNVKGKGKRTYLYDLLFFILL